VAQPSVLILRSAGTNCDLEAQHAWERAGAGTQRVHVRRLTDEPQLLREYQVLTLPGGFSYGDDIGAGRILAAQLERHLLAALHEFIDRGGLVLGICNGFQVLVQAGLLPWRRADGQPRTCTVAANEPPGFQDRWVCLEARAKHSVFLEAGRRYEMPIAHGEGRVAFTTPADFAAVRSRGLDALTYVDPPAGAQRAGGMPANPNGSTGDIAGLCDDTGRVLGLMPHPERFVDWTQHPCWSSQPARSEGDGLAMFRRAVAHLR